MARASLLLDSKWDLIVINNLLDKPQRFSDLKAKISGGIKKPITSSSLTRVLRKLEHEEIILKDIHSEIGESVEVKYTLTTKGKALKPVIGELTRWGESYLV